jgi:hypothetical protein
LLLVHLAGDKAVIAERMAARDAHFMPTSLLDSQFADLEPPEAESENVITLDVSQPLPALAATGAANSTTSVPSIKTEITEETSGDNIHSHRSTPRRWRIGGYWALAYW